MKENAPILDACCGSKMFWFEHNKDSVIFLDKRKFKDTLCDGRTLVIDPDIIGDFTNLPFLNNRFHMVVFDPPHMNRLGKSSWMAKKYGRLESGWKSEISAGFSECFRVLKPFGTLVFKWNEYQIPVKDVLKLSPITPLFGNRNGRLNKSHWIIFMKPEKACEYQHPH